MRVSGIFSLALLALVTAGMLWWWYGWRIEPANGEFAVLMRKTGSDLPVGQILASEPNQKGVREEVLPEGRYFRNPYTWGWEIVRATEIPAGKFGVLIRKFGKDLPGGEIIAPDEHHKGIVREVLGTGRHRINPYAYDVHIYDDIKIAPGHIGVVVTLTGNDILAGIAPATMEKGFLVADGEKGVQAAVLKEGTHRLNPFIYAVSIVNIQSQRVEFNGPDAITFLTLDGFPVVAEGTLEFNISIDKAALLTHEIGDMEDVKTKLILPSARGFSRIEGSKKTATEFIVGESRQAFQNNLEAYLRGVCAVWGISVNSVLIRDIIPPQEIAAIIRDRELADQESRRIEQEIVAAVSKAELVKQEALAEQNRQKVAAETERIKQGILAEQGKVEKTIAAQTALDVATIALDTAKSDAGAKLAAAEAQRKVIASRNEAEAAVLKLQVGVFPDEADYVLAKLYEATAPAIETVLANTDGGGLLGLPLRVRETPAPAAPVVAEPRVRASITPNPQ